MTSMLVEPQFVATAAADVQNLGSTIDEARAAAAGSTTNVVAAAEDEVSAITAQFFRAFGQEYQALIQQAAAFHNQFAAALAGAQAAYTQAETAAMSMLGGGGAAANPAGYVASVVTQAVANDPVHTLVMGGSGTPIPSSAYISNVVSRYLQNPLFNPLFPVDTATPGLLQGLFTPEGLYPLTGIKDLTLATSLQRGVEILNNQLVGANPPYAGLLTDPTNTVNVLGYSQSAIISSLEMHALNPTNLPGGSPFFDTLKFTLLGDPMNPNGGLLERFAGLSLPSLGLDFLGATPDNSFATNIFTLEYDGYADFPKYPIDFLSDLNAFMGIAFVHGTYPTLSAAQLASAIPLPVSGTPSTTYYMIPTANLPLLDPVRAIPFIGNPMADLVQPDLTYLVNWGYGNPNFGWNTGPANVPTPFGVLPPISDTLALPALLASGAQQGAGAFMTDISTLGTTSLPALASTGSAGIGGLGLPAALTSAQLSPTGIIQAIQTANTTVATDISTTASNLYATLLPTADIANALMTSIPSYDFNLFLDGIQQVINGDPTGGLIYAFGAPVAADFALGTLAGGFETEVLLGALGLSL